jgi:capsular exopolysaccharide synthesis family protein
MRVEAGLRSSVVQPTEFSSGAATIRDYLRVIRRRKPVIIAALVAGTATAVALSLSGTKIYEARALVLLQTRLAETVFQDENPRQTSIQTEIRVLKSTPVRLAVEKKLGFSPGVTAGALPNSNVFDVRAHSPDPKGAALIANAYAESYIEYRRTQAVNDLKTASAEVQKSIDRTQAQIDALTAEIAQLTVRQGAQFEPLIARRDGLVSQLSILRRRLDQLGADAAVRSGGAQVVTPATASNTPVSPKPKRDGVTGLTVGLALGLALAFLYEHFDDTIKAKGHLERAISGLPVLGAIPAVGSWKRRGDPLVISRTEPNSPAAEAYRSLRTSISFIGFEHANRTLQITSPSAGDGKTTTLANVAVALARAGHRVIVVGCDLRRPRIHEFFGLPNDVGFTSVLQGGTPLTAAMQDVEGEPNLRLLASGPLPPNPSEVLTSPRTREILAALEHLADTVLLDSPPVLPVTDAAILATQVDATFIVATSGKTTKRGVARAIELLHQVGAPVVGAIFNGVDVDEHYGADRHSYYRQDDQPFLRLGRRPQPKSEAEPAATTQGH